MKKFFKKIFDNIGLFVLISPFIIVPVASIILGVYFSFDRVVDFLTKIGSGNWFFGLIIAPLSIVAIIQMFRGAILLADVDADIFRLNERKQDWKGSLYAAVNFLCYVAFFMLLKNI